MSGQTILITGGAGFVGSNLAIGLKEHDSNTRIIALDNLKRRGSELNINRLRECGVEFIHGDIRNPDDIAESGPIDVLLECSAEPSVLAGYESSPRYLLDTNLGGTINCLEHARAHGAGFIFLSTSRVYPMEALNAIELIEQETRFEIASDQTTPGISTRGISEMCPLQGPRSLYGTTKLASELILQEYINMYDMRGIINRCGVLTGPWQMGKVDQGFVVLWVARHLFGGSLSYIGYGGKGKQVRDILHTRDLLKLITHQIEHLDALSGGLFNVGGGLDISVSLAELTDLCEKHTGNTIQMDSVAEAREADIPVYLTDHSHVTEVSGWKPETTPDQIVAEITQWLRENEAVLRPILT